MASASCSGHLAFMLARGPLLITDGCLPLRGARAQIDPDGTCHLAMGTWHATIHAAPAGSRPPG